MKVIALLFLISSVFAQSFGEPPVSSYAKCAKDISTLKALKKVLKDDYTRIAESTGLNRARVSIRFRRGRVSIEQLPYSSRSFGLVPSLTIESNGTWVFGLEEVEPSQIKCEYRYEIFLTVTGIDNEGDRVRVRTPGKLLNLSAPAIYSVK